jgi:hypothetical protein
MVFKNFIQEKNYGKNNKLNNVVEVAKFITFNVTYPNS